ncbi:hypothetical protein BDF20DRAFT_834868 [Mycotypha africana]|uniref:uncharacterized protein n=1 Tax=Mycotypha africana TaxID=64632 RepID=UPI002301425E|nr:uncharacterized protein BDF20DRAFT_834868 [Mycotypha africana]KAI8982228.1 hypothetical protein BDF20DRAFT_834868 [Mycotypha africana]
MSSPGVLMLKRHLFFAIFSLFVYTVFAASLLESLYGQGGKEKKEGLIRIRKERGYDRYILHFYYDHGQKRGKTSCSLKRKQTLRQLKQGNPVLFETCTQSDLEYGIECEVGSIKYQPRCAEWQSTCTQKWQGTVMYDDCQYIAT